MVACSRRARARRSAGVRAPAHGVRLHLPHAAATHAARHPAYAARYLAKNVVAAGLAERCVIQLSYAIGVAQPLSVYIDFAGTGRVDEEKLSGVLRQLMDLSPRGIRTHLGLNKPIYGPTAAYGHFGRKPEGDLFPWERVDLVEDLKTALAA